ncbi:2Fe-2S iron-sulfur cluster binding domain-containing protein [candidate division KSB1 bacterium]|nr:2Fe-2S iron-sulfur cluster binding domain-containing protein [candidate division KSB1 bacterium]
MPTVTFQNENIKVEVPEGATLRKAANKAGVSVYGGPNKLLNCRGFGLCGSDKITVTPDTCVSKPSFFEKLQFGEGTKTRLACQAKITGDVIVNTALAMEYGEEMRENLKFVALAGVFGILTLGAVVFMVFEMVGKPLF